MTRSLLVLADRLGELGVTRVVVEATSDYWKSPFYLLEAHGFGVWLVNANDVKHLPGRPKTDKPDAAWPCKLAERQVLPAQLRPPPPVRRLRDLTRYRADLVAARTAEKNRVEELPGDAQAKLSVVASDVFGVSGRAMPAALVAGERDPRCWRSWPAPPARQAQPVGGAFCGRFSDHHAFLLDTMLGRTDQASADVAAVEAHIEAGIAPFQAAADRPDGVSGVGRAAAQVVIAEVGVDVGRFPTAGHLVSGPGLRPASRSRPANARARPPPGTATLPGPGAGRGRRADQHLPRRALPAHRPPPRHQKAIVAVGRSILVIIWHLLADPDARFCGLGPGFCDPRIDADRRKRNHARQLEALGSTVTPQPAA